MRAMVVNKVRRLPGSAAHSAARLLHRRGFRLLGKPESFYVEDTLGPLDEGELARARVGRGARAEPAYVVPGPVAALTVAGGNGRG